MQAEPPNQLAQLKDLTQVDIEAGVISDQTIRSVSKGVDQNFCTATREDRPTFTPDRFINTPGKNPNNKAIPL